MKEVEFCAVRQASQKSYVALKMEFCLQLAEACRWCIRTQVELPVCFECKVFCFAAGKGDAMCVVGHLHEKQQESYVLEKEQSLEGERGEKAMRVREMKRASCFFCFGILV